MDIRAANTDDAPVVAELVAALLGELDGSPGDLEAVARDVLMQEERVAGFLAFEGGRAVGVILLSEGYAMFARGAFGQITELYVRPELRSAGIAARLLAAAIEHGRVRGWRRIDVGAPPQPQWERTVSFYKSNGFVDVGPRLKLVL
ncbi:GNAT family N-acetyltransferase [Paraburkholderia bannensis]|uniref:GNAT family N-acetyltransferase n=1 Tax=Paraburkholderia bannensis TaxID=765414 RepID=UPI002ABD24F5|nr:GNAT family N-acetyltransferase [Paraburkholderia bannensis]